jgi:hypothetical protein
MAALVAGEADAKFVGSGVAGDPLVGAGVGRGVGLGVGRGVGVGVAPGPTTVNVASAYVVPGGQAEPEQARTVWGPRAAPAGTANVR